MPRVLRRLIIVFVLLSSAGAGFAFWPGKPSDGRPNLAGKDAAGQGQKAGPPDAPRNAGGRRGGFAGNGPVTAAVASVTTGAVRIVQTGLGSVVSRNSVMVRSRVSGQLTQVFFKEGQLVHVGDVLAEIDPRPFEVLLTQAQGQLARDQALLANARRDWVRFKTLAAQDSVAGQQVDAQESLVRQYEGVVLADQGQVDNAKLQLGFTKITAPLSGRIGLRLIDPGNNISPTDAQGLAVINEVQPVTVVFALPEDHAPAITRRLREAEARKQSLVVETWDRSNKTLLAQGSLLTMDNQIDPASGTIKLKALFANADNALIQNQFVNARLLLDTRENLNLIPAAAVQHGSAGSFVYVVKDDQTVTVRPVSLGPADGDKIAIEAGLQAGERVVVNGVDRLREGAKVELAAADASAAAPWQKEDKSPVEPLAGQAQQTARHPPHQP